MHEDKPRVEYIPVELEQALGLKSSRICLSALSFHSLAINLYVSLGFTSLKIKDNTASCIEKYLTRAS